MKTTSTVNIENLANSGRSLTWIEPPTCRSCTLPFSSNDTDVTEKRLPLLLNCQHVLCEPCVLEYRTRNGIVCQQCKTETPLMGDENSALSLQPSLYLLGAIQQGQYELLNLDQYSVPDKPDRKRPNSPAPATRKLLASELDTVEQVRKLLETAHHLYERNNKKLETCGRQQEENVSMVLEQVNGCFLKRHHLLQLAEQQMMSKIRGRYVELRHQREEAQSQLQQSQKQLKGYLKLVKKYKKEQTTDSRSKEAWLAFSAEVKEFLETAPLRLLDDVKQHGTPFFCKPVEESLFLRSIPTYGTMVTENKKCAELKLLPYTAQAEEKERSKEKGHKSSPDCSSTNSQQREKEKSSSVVGRTKDRKRSPDRTTSQRENEKTPPQNQQREQHHSGSSSKNKQKPKDKRPLKDKSEISSVATIPSSSSQSPSLQMSQQISLEGDFIPHENVVVTNVNSPHEIFVQRELFAQHSQTMAETCSLDAEQYASECPEQPLKIVEGTMYLVQPVVPSSFSWHSKWYRARVLKAYPSQQYLVEYIDFGHQEQVPASKICPISKDLRALDFCAQKVQLYGLAMVPPEQAGGKDAKLAECCQVLIDLIAHRTLMMATLSANSKSTAYVDLLVPRSCSTRQPPQSLRSALLYLGFCKPHQGTELPTSVTKRHEKWMQARYKSYAKMLPSPQIAEVDTFPCTILHSSSPDSFQLMPRLWLKTKLEPLQQLLAVYGPNAPKVYHPFVGLICAFGVDEGDGTVRWMRCRIERVGLAECDLKAIDSGRQYACVPWYNIRQLDPAADSYWMHPLALECRLAHISPKVTTTAGDGDEALWSKEAIAEFNTIVGSQSSDFEVTIERCESDHSYSVLLYLLNRSTKDTCINGTLVRNGHAISCGPVNALADRTKNVVEVIDPMTADPVPNAQPPSKGRKERLRDPRIRVEVLSPIGSPSEFYIRLQSCVAGLDELHHTIQQYMEQMLEEENEQPEEELGVGHLCVAFTTTSSGASDSEWYRACITGVAEPFYQMLLIDTAQSVKVHRTNIARLPSRFAQIQPGAVRCRLGNVVPVGGQQQWHQTSIDGFKKVIASSTRHAISLDVANMKNTDSELPVVLWSVIEEEVAPLAPRRDRYININQSLVNYGLAHPISRPGTSAVQSGKGDAGGPENPEAILEEAISAQFRARFEQMQQFFRTVDDVTGNQTASAAVRMRDIVGSATDSACHELISLIDQQPLPISDWLPPQSAPIEKTVFVGQPTFVGDDGAVYLHDECQEPLLKRIAEKIRLHVESAHEQDSQQGKRKMHLLAGDPCLARFHLDGQWYRGKVLEVKQHHYSVQFVDYGNVEQCKATDLWDETICTRIPVQAHRLRLANVQPADTHGWTRPAVETFHSLIVGKRCTVRIVDQKGTAQDPETPLCTLQTIGDENCIGVDVDQALLSLDGLFVNRPGRQLNLNERSYQQLMVQETISPPHSSRAAQDIIALMNEVQEQFGRSPGAASDGQADDPYAWNDGAEEDDTSGDLANRAQIFNLYSPDHHSSASSSDAGCVAVEDSLLSTPLPSPATFVSNELETSSRLCSVERDDNDEVIDADIKRTRGGAVPFRGFRMLELNPSQTGFYASCTNYSDPLTLHIYPHLEGHRKLCDQMAKSIQEYARSTNKMGRWQAMMLEPGSPCLALYAEDGLYYRAIIEGWDEVERTARVLYVDYLNRAVVSIDRDLRKCPIALRNVPVHNLLVRLAGVQPNPNRRPDDVSRQLVTHLQRTFFVRVVGKVTKRVYDDDEPEESFDELAEPANEIPLVELYTEADCTTLIYQKLIDEKVFIKPSFSISRKR